MQNGYTITGADAIRLAARDGLTIHSTRGDVDAAEAGSMIRFDGAESVWVAVTPDGWWDGGRVASTPDGYRVDDYFTSSGMYLGPDDDGIEPTWDDAYVTANGSTN